MTTIQNTEVRIGMTVLGEDGELYTVLDVRTPNPDDKAATLRWRLKNVATGLVHDQRMEPTGRVERVSLQTQTLLFLYPRRGNFMFMDSESFDEIPLPPALVGDARSLREGDEAKVTFYNGQAIACELLTEDAEV